MLNRRMCALVVGAVALAACSPSVESTESPDSRADELTTARDRIREKEAVLTDKLKQKAEAADRERPEPTEDPKPSEEPTADGEREDRFDPGKCTAPVEGAYACAGGPVPAEARSLPAVTRGEERLATLMMPSGNIGCDVTTGAWPGATCLVLSWESRMKPDYDEWLGGQVSVNLNDMGEVRLGQLTDTPRFLSSRPDDPAPTELPYGTVWHMDDYVFASSESGLTLWNAETGHGALIKRAGFFPFSR